VLIGEDDGDIRLVAADDVAVGDHVAILRNQHARTEAARKLIARPEGIVAAEEIFEEWIVDERGVRAANYLHRRDVDDTFDGLSGDAREIGEAAGRSGSDWRGYRRGLAGALHCLRERFVCRAQPTGEDKPRKKP
jgi:intein/homing endonuclease